MADQRSERLKEQIKYETEVLRFVALVMIALGGEAISLFFENQPRSGLAWQDSAFVEDCSTLTTEEAHDTRAGEV